MLLWQMWRAWQVTALMRFWKPCDEAKKYVSTVQWKQIRIWRMEMKAIYKLLLKGSECPWWIKTALENDTVWSQRRKCSSPRAEHEKPTAMLVWRQKHCMDQNYGLLNKTEQSRFSKQHWNYKCAHDVAPREDIVLCEWPAEIYTGVSRIAGAFCDIDKLIIHCAKTFFCK